MLSKSSENHLGYSDKSFHTFKMLNSDTSTTVFTFYLLSLFWILERPTKLYPHFQTSQLSKQTISNLFSNTKIFEHHVLWWYTGGFWWSFSSHKFIWKLKQSKHLIMLCFKYWKCILVSDLRLNYIGLIFFR